MIPLKSGELSVGKYYAQYVVRDDFGVGLHRRLRVIKYGGIYSNIFIDISMQPESSTPAVQHVLYFELNNDEIFEHLVFNKFCENC